jgi:hypothetical protein|tara:strand:+ start:4778 stop:6046 length:1269 start_codon:yes stop_codon:yes gene_type:complete
VNYIVDRRLNSKNKSTVNRQRFLRRYKEQIKKAVDEAVTKRSITDLERGEQITIPSRDVSEPVFGHGRGGVRDAIHPGNRDFIPGDTIKRPKSGSGGGAGGDASDSGEGMDDFVFQITQEEFLDFMFNDLELPNLIKKQLAGTDSFKYVRAGFADVGIPAKLNIIRTMRAAHARRVALSGKSRRCLKELECRYQEMLEAPEQDSEELDRVLLEIEELTKRVRSVPFLDDFDLKYNLHVKEPQPTSRAVMFCVMDVSGSMDQATKEIAKRFFILLYLFLRRNYERTELVFIRHHTSAKEVDEEEFFYSRETGGTIVSSALKLTKEILDDRYPIADWNIYVAQASDGDNWNDDSPLCKEILVNQLLPLMSYFSYIEITPRNHQALWREYEKIVPLYPDSFALRQIEAVSDIYPVFRDLFQRKEA